MEKYLSRRSIIGAALLATGTAFLTAESAVADPDKDVGWGQDISANGWPISSPTESYRIEGSNVDVELISGDAAVILLHVARRYHYEIATLRADEVVGVNKNIQIVRPYESNYLNGTAIAIRPLLYPAGTSGQLYPSEIVVIRDILRNLDGAVTWGGDEEVPMESHFQIALPPRSPSLAETANKIQAWNRTPDDGAGMMSAFHD